MSWNELLLTGSQSLPTLPADGNCFALLAPKRSQIRAVLILPIGLQSPTEWTDSDAVEAVVDNSLAGNFSGKWLQGIGEVPLPEAVTATLGSNTQIICRRRYTLSLDVLTTCDENYTFLRSMQRNPRGYRFWYYTMADRLIGGPTGITPCFTDAGFIYGPALSDVERGNLRIQWDSDIDHQRALVPGIFSDNISSTPVTVSTNVIRQPFSNASSPSLTWTENGGSLTAPYPNNVWVFQNGQKLYEHLGQYSITPDSGPGESTITVDGTVHYQGANYEVYLFES